MNKQPVVLALSPETVLDLHLEYGMPQELYDELSTIMDADAKKALCHFTLVGLHELNGKVGLGDALYMIISTLVEASKKYSNN